MVLERVMKRHRNKIVRRRGGGMDGETATGCAVLGLGCGYILLYFTIMACVAIGAVLGVIWLFRNV